MERSTFKLKNIKQRNTFGIICLEVLTSFTIRKNGQELINSSMKTKKRVENTD